MPIRTQKQQDACAENNVLRAIGSLDTALRQAGMQNLYEWATASQQMKAEIKRRQRLRKDEQK